MAEKVKIIPKRNYDISIVSNDGGKYSPSLRKLRQHYFHDPGRIFSSSIPPNDSMSASLKCDDCQKHDGLFQCCHCNQRLCIRCCNKHHKKVTNELEYLNESTDRLLMKIFYIKTDLEKQKTQTIEQCQKWRIETINKINQAHTTIIQTIQDEYDILNKEYEDLVEKEMSQINIELLKIKKGNLGTLISSPTSIRKDSKTSMDLIKERIETFAKQIEERRKCSFQVKFPTFDIDDNLRVKSSFGEDTSAICHNNDTESKTNSSDVEPPSDQCDSTYGTGSSSSVSSLPDSSEDRAPISRRHTFAFHPTTLPIETKENDGIIRQRRRTTVLPIRSRSSIITDRLANEYRWLYNRTKSTSSFIQ